MNSYRLLGPTRVHLEQELYQLAAMLLLTVSTLQGIRQQDEYTWGLIQWGDLKYVLLVGLWLGRNILVRWICTSDQSTHKTASVKGVVAHWLCSLFVGSGQYFNRPHPKAVAKKLGTHHSDDGRNEIVALKDLLFPAILYTWHAINVRIIFPFLQAKDAFVSRLPPNLKANLFPSKKADNKMDSKKGNDRSASTHLKLSRLYTQFRKLWGRYVPPPQILPVFMFALMVYWKFFERVPVGGDGTHALTMHSMANSKAFGIYSQPYGLYQKKVKPTWVVIFVLMSIIGTTATILLYGRVFLPVGDLVEGSGNVLKSIRSGFKPVPQHPTGHHHHHGSGKSKSKSHYKEVPEPISFPESYVSVAHENRFRLLSKSTSIRIIENLVVCALFPRTHVICRFAGHCREGMSWSQLTKVLFPVGIVTALRVDGEPESPFVFVNTERGAMIATTLSIVLITLTSLLTQGATLNRAYLSTMGYLAGGWTIVSQSHPAIRGKQKAQPWDPRKQYKRGDIICQQFPGLGTQKLYMATTDLPEGKPYDLSLRVVHDTFRNEHCHPANSDLIKFLVRMQLNMNFGLIIMIVCYHIVGMDCASLRWILLANIVAAYGIIRSTRTRGLSELQTLAREVSGPPSEESSEEGSVYDSDNESAGGED